MVLLLEPGMEVAAGSYICADCGHLVTLQTDADAVLPECPDRQRQPHPQQGWRAVYGRTVAQHRPAHVSRFTQPTPVRQP
jgi:hypothetical protein